MIVQRSRTGMSKPGKEGSKRCSKSDLRPDDRLMDTTQTEREKPLNNIRRSRVRDRPSAAPPAICSTRYPPSKIGETHPLARPVPLPPGRYALAVSLPALTAASGRCSLPDAESPKAEAEDPRSIGGVDHRRHKESR